MVYIWSDQEVSGFSFQCIRIGASIYAFSFVVYKKYLLAFHVLWQEFGWSLHEGLGSFRKSQI